MNRLIAFTLCFAAALCFLSTGSAKDKSTKAVSKIDDTVSVRLSWREKRTEPTVVSSPEQLQRVMPNRQDAHRIGKAVDFKTQRLLIFAWEGDAQDRLAVKAEDAAVRFVHWDNDGGNDPHLHCHLFAVQNSAKYSVEMEPDPR